MATTVALVGVGAAVAASAAPGGTHAPAVVASSGSLHGAGLHAARAIPAVKIKIGKCVINSSGHPSGRGYTLNVPEDNCHYQVRAATACVNGQSNKLVYGGVVTNGNSWSRVTCDIFVYALTPWGLEFRKSPRVKWNVKWVGPVPPGARLAA